MTSISTIKNLAASSAVAGFLGLAVLGLGTAVAAAEPSDSGASMSSASDSGPGTSSTPSTSTSSSTPSSSGTSPTSVPTGATTPVTVSSAASGDEAKQLQQSLQQEKDQAQKASDSMTAYNDLLRSIKEKISQ